MISKLVICKNLSCDGFFKITSHMNLMQPMFLNPSSIKNYLWITFLNSWIEYNKTRITFNTVVSLFLWSRIGHQCVKKINVKVWHRFDLHFDQFFYDYVWRQFEVCLTSIAHWVKSRASKDFTHYHNKYKLFFSVVC